MTLLPAADDLQIKEIRLRHVEIAWSTQERKVFQSNKVGMNAIPDFFW
jgi:hypothetical protein